MKHKQKTGELSKQNEATFESEGFNPNDIRKVTKLREMLDKVQKIIDKCHTQIYNGEKPDRVCYGCHRGTFCYAIVKVTYDCKMEIHVLCQRCIRNTPGMKKDDLTPCLWFCDPEVKTWK